MRIPFNQSLNNTPLWLGISLSSTTQHAARDEINRVVVLEGGYCLFNKCNAFSSSVTDET